MERQPSVFDRLRSRNTYDSIPNNDGGDEWYIPYSPNTRPNLPTRESGIGLSPISPTKPSTNYSMFTNVFSTTTNAIAGPSNSKPFPYPARPATTTPQNTYTSTYNNPAVGVSRLLPSSTRKQGTLYKSPSYNSISDMSRTERIPSSSSVPTGLAGPKILFSPLNRELRAGAEPAEGHYPTSPSKTNPSAQQKKSYPPSSFNPIQRSQPLGSTARQRTVSAPRPTRNKNPHEYRAENKRWAVPTMCDMFLLPRPTLLPHEITPPTTPEDENEKRLSVGSMNSTNNGETVLEKGRYRDEEREEWAELVKRRGRSLSLGSTAPPPGAPIIGNARARSRERSMDGVSGRRSRSNSLIRALTPSTSLRKRSASFGSRFTNSNSNDHSRKSSMNRRESDRKPSKRDREASFLNIEGRGATFTNEASSANYGGHHQSKQRFSAPRYSSDDYMYLSQKNRKRSTSLPYSSNYAKTRSDPLLASFATSTPAVPPSESRYPSAAIPAGKSLQFKQPSVADKGDRGGVVIISKGASRRTSSKYEREGTFRPPAPLNLSKPLPDIPIDDSSPILPESGPFVSLTDEIGVAISPDLGGMEKEKVVVVDQEGPKTAPLPGTSDSLSPVKSRLSDGGSATARAFLAKQQQRARTKRAFQSPSSKGAGNSIRAKVDAPIGQGQGHPSTSASTPTTASTSISSVLSPTSSTGSIKSDGPRRKTALEEAIGRSRASSVGILEQQQARFSPTRIALLENRPNTSESRDKKFGGNTNTNSVPPAPRVSIHSPTKYEQQRFSSPDLSYSISPPALDYPISTVPSPRTKTGPIFLDVQHQPQPHLSRPSIVHGETNVSKVTVYTDASEGWSRVGSSAVSTPVSERKGRGSLASEESPGQTPDDRDFQGLFFRTPADRNGSFSNTPIPNHYAPSSNYLTLPRVIPEGPTPVGLGYDMDPIPNSQIVLQDDDQPRRPSDGSESTAEIATPNMAQSQAEMQQPYMGYLNQLDRNENAVNPDVNRLQQRLMAPWNSRRPITPDSPDRELEVEDGEEVDERSMDTHETAIPILSEGHEFPFPRSHDTIRNLSQAQTQAEAQTESATQTTPDGKRRHPPHAPLSPGTFGIIADSDNSTSPSSKHDTSSKHINFAPSSFQNYSLNPHTQTSRGLSLSPIPSHGSAAGSSTSPVLGFDHRHSAAVSFFDEFPTPPGEHQ